MSSGKQWSFSQVPSAQIQRSVFNRSHGLKTAFNAGYLIPIYVDEALPGDSFNLKLNAFARLATPTKPVMDNLYFDTHFFAVPMRLIWSHANNFFGERATPTDTTVYQIPQITTPAGGAVTNSLSDYLGIPVGIASLAVDSLWHRAYNLIWNEWYRDQNLQDPVTVDLGDGPDTYTNYVLLRRGKRHDYFTSCLPWPQKGADVTLPLGTAATVKTSAGNLYTGAHPAAIWKLAASGNALITDRAITAFDTESLGYSASVLASSSGSGIYPSNLYADLSTATAATINSLRQAFQYQKMLERDARGGTRYIELVKSHFSVDSPDLRAVRPIYLGGGSQPVNIHPVAQTSVTAGTPQGNLAAFGTVGVHGHGFTKSFTEHCVLLGLASVRAEMSYSQGLPRHFSRRTKYDFYWPSLAHIGEQSVLNKEIYCQGTADDNLVFGYQERFAEYRYKPSLITGIMRSVVTAGFTTIDYWHLAQKFLALPTLNTTFIQENPPIDRVIAVNTEPHFILDAYFDLKCARPMPTFSVPGLIDHF